MKSYLDTMRDERNKIEYSAMELEALSRAFYATGNVVMGGTLALISAGLLENSKNIDKAVGQELSDQLRRSQEATKNMVSAALAMGKVNDA